MLEVEEEVPEGEERYHSHPLWQLLAECLEFKELYATRKSGNRHINIGELRGTLRAEERHAQRGGGCREIYALDSQVALGCLVKGRSSSSSLNQELVRSLPTILMREMYCECIYFETSINRADDPTRGKEVRGPTMPLPSWWEELARGEFRGFDEWLVLHGVHPEMLGKLPPFSELLHGEKLEEMMIEEERRLFRCNQFSKVRDNGAADDDELLEKEAPSALGRTGPEERAEDADTEAERAVAEAEEEGSGSLTTRVTKGTEDESERSEEEQKKSEVQPEVVGEKDETERKPKVEKPELSKACRALLEKIPISQFVGLEGGSFDSEVKGFLDLFSGVRGVARELARLTGRWVLCYDIEHSEEVKKSIEKMVECGCFLGLGGGPVCGSFSMAVTPPVRTCQLGRPGVSPSMQEKIKQGNRFAAWMIGLITLALRLGLGVWLENPSSSWLFRLPMWKRLMRRHPELGVWLVDYCRFFMRWRKRTAVVSNTELRDHRTLCRGGHQHLVLRGRCKEKKKNWTRIAQSYPRGVALALAYGLASFKGLAVWHGRFDPALCARAGHKRIGEAGNPGPRKSGGVRSGDLRAVGLVDARTLALQDKAWAGFCKWAYSKITPDAFRSAMALPVLLAELLREYGYYSYGSGGSLFMFRHLVVFVQQQIPGSKVVLGVCWETISRWEIAEPVEHRTPVPFALFLAMVGVALSWKWRSFAGIMLVSFLGISRPGEALGALRSDLILPSDRLEFNSSIAYLRVGRAKGRRRGKNVIQHLTIDDKPAVSFLEKTFSSVHPDLPLYGGSHSAFRRRWDAILEVLLVPHVEEAAFMPSTSEWKSANCFGE